MKLDIRLHEDDRTRLGAPDVLVLDMDRVRDTPARMLIRWESETGYPIERALTEIESSTVPPAAAVLVAVWLARKQMGADGGGEDAEGRPETYVALADLRTMRVGYSVHVEPEQLGGGDVDPPASPPAPSSGS